MQKVRRNALHRYWEGNKGALSLYGFRIDPDRRILHTLTREIQLEERLSKAQIHSIVCAQKRLIDVSKKMTHEIVAEKIQDKLL